MNGEIINFCAMEYLNLSLHLDILETINLTNDR